LLGERKNMVWHGRLSKQRLKQTWEEGKHVTNIKAIKGRKKARRGLRGGRSCVSGQTKGVSQLCAGGIESNRGKKHRATHKHKDLHLGRNAIKW